MKPNEHMKLPDDELIAHIKEQLMAHEEDYAPGAWENFNSEKPARKRGIFFWLGSMSSAAALILIGFALFFVNKKERIKALELSVTKPAGPYSLPKKTDTSADSISEMAESESGTQARGSSNLTPSVLKKKEIPAVRILALRQLSSHPIAKNNREFAANAAVPAVAEQQPETKTITQQNTIEVPGTTAVNPPLPQKGLERVVVEAPASDKPQSFEDFLAQESKNGNARGRRPDPKLASLSAQEDKWEMGVMVAPSVGNSKKLNMGYGLSMGYALSKKVSINSGISYNEMAASRSAYSPSGAQDMPATTTKGLAGNSRELKAVDASIRGIDIPLEIRYRFNKNLYANVGISAFAVLNQRQKNTFLESQVQNSPVDPQGIAYSFKADVLSTTVTTEEQHTSELKTDPYLGFYNFSLGYKQRISRGKSVSLEPFVKLPIKEFTQENLYLIGTGLRLKFDF
ncbi:hypothetical protein [Pedobacter gandavensis]|uniref:hypothetical protein n=1 Tax=Pedobacter gandavensis TaxID=2679963 RepID=UPI002931343D|nr:hypothetical protein [Pedobacter gandavensis]